MNNIERNYLGSVAGRSPLLCSGSVSNVIDMVNLFGGVKGVKDTVMVPHNFNIDLDSTFTDKISVYAEYYSIMEMLDVVLAQAIYCNSGVCYETIVNSLVSSKFFTYLESIGAIKDFTICKTLARVIEANDGKSYNCFLDILEDINNSEELLDIKEYLYAGINTVITGFSKSELSFKDYIEEQYNMYFKLLAKSITFKICSTDKNTCIGAADVPVIFLPVFNNVGTVSDVYEDEYKFDTRLLQYISNVNVTGVHSIRELKQAVNLTMYNRSEEEIEDAFNILLHNMITKVLGSNRRYGNELYSYTAGLCIEDFKSVEDLVNLI